LWSSNFYPALKQLGHQIIESQIDLLPASRFMQIAQDFTPEEKEVRSRLTEKKDYRGSSRSSPKKPDRPISKLFL
jgi:hypothetical protein